jgi:hypothetical protein
MQGGHCPRDCKSDGLLWERHFTAMAVIVTESHSYKKPFLHKTVPAQNGSYSRNLSDLC